MNENIKTLLKNIDYFLEWGGSGWKKLFIYSLSFYLNNKINEKTILEIGARNCKMSCFFALSGANVIATDTEPKLKPYAEKEVEKWGCGDKIKLLYCNDYLKYIPDKKIDLIFTKSVLVSVPELEDFLYKLDTKLSPSGKVVFIENAKGNIISGIFRFFWNIFLYLRKGWKRWEKNFSYIENKHITQIKKIFKIEIVKRTTLPPVILICGEKLNKT